MKPLATILVITTLLLTGCATSGRYQIGGSYQDPHVDNRTVVPMIDTQTGQLYLYYGSGSSLGNWRLEKKTTNRLPD